MSTTTDTVPIAVPHRRRPRAHPVRRMAALVAGMAVATVIAVALAVAVVPAVSGAHALTVLTGSMVPALPPGWVVVTRPVPAEEIAAGDVITFTDRVDGSDATRIVTHRVTDVQDGPDGRSFGTRGDANNVADEGRVAAADVIGEQWYVVPHVGAARQFLTSPTGLLYAAGILLLFVAGHLIVPRTARRRS